ncbi:MAG: hypothetical protein IKT32_00765, partial [Clostridia bacterium]|nr:hypothetical protein [Clostridia bacterium]
SRGRKPNINKGVLIMGRTYTVYYETESHRGQMSIKYGELAALQRMCKERGHKIYKIEYLVDGKVIKIRRF